METVNQTGYASGPSYVRAKGIDSHNVDIHNAEQDLPDFTKSPGHVIETDTILRSEDIDEERFMNQEITIFLQESVSEFESDFVEVNVNGDYRIGVRGSEMTIRRKHLGVLAQAKQSRVRQKKSVNPDGSMSFTEQNVVSLTYPFQVITDPDPRRGGPWLRDLLKNNV